MFSHELNKYIPKPKIKKYKNVYFFNGKLYKFGRFEAYSKHWKMAENTIFMKLKTLIKNTFKANNLPIKKINSIEEAIFFTDEKSNYYFHWMLDSLQRLQLIDLKYKFEVRPPILIQEIHFKEMFIRNSLEYYNFDLKVLNEGNLYKIKRLIVPFHLAQSGNFNVQIVNQIRNKFLSNSNKVYSYPKKIWISRQNSRIRKVKNFSEIQNILLNHGFKIMEIEGLEDLNKQIEFINNADVIGGIHGGGLSNMLFLDEKKIVIEVRGRNDNHNNCYFSLSSALNLKYYYFEAEVLNNNFYHEDYKINPSNFDKFLENIL